MPERWPGLPGTMRTAHRDKELENVVRAMRYRFAENGSDLDAFWSLCEQIAREHPGRQGAGSADRA